MGLKDQTLAETACEFFTRQLVVKSARLKSRGIVWY